ncbi:MAG: hypothetical protein AAGJ37_08810 [Pseudomonadota bacterium]
MTDRESSSLNTRVTFIVLALFWLTNLTIPPVRSETDHPLYQFIKQDQTYDFSYLPQPTGVTSGCTQNIQLIATTPESVILANALVDDFLNDGRLAPLHICLHRPIWIESTALKCHFDNNTTRSECDLSRIKPWLSINAISHIAIVLDKGKAYTYQGIMYLDTEDDYDVFVHELAHFAGFMDEYALSSSSANQHCDPVIGINLIRQNGESEAKQTNLALWEAQGLKYTTSTAKTCESVDVVTIKPSDKLTFMEYHNIAYIPDIYLSLWHHQLISGYQYNLMRLRLGLPVLALPDL